MIQLLIVKTGSTYPDIAEQHGDFDTWFVRILERPGLQITVCDVAAGGVLPDPADFDAVVITGSPAMVTEQALWSEAATAWLRDWVGAGNPVLGVCYGHQLLAHALGGTVDYHPEGREMGTLEVRLTEAAHDDPLLGSYPPRFLAHLTHRQTVSCLPPGAVLLGASNHEPHQAFRVGACTWGMQFHPEFNEDIMRAYVERLKPALAEEGRDPEAILAALQPTGQAQQVLHRFVEWVMK
jgi:GMP synthase (glutamine-hydrolysing)